MLGLKLNTTIIGLCLCFISAHTAIAGSGSAANGMVTVAASSGDPGVEKVVCVGEKDFHITTKDVPRNAEAPKKDEASFEADVSVTGIWPWEVKPVDPKEFKLGIGDSAEYAVEDTEDGEQKESGNITLFKVDVEIDGVDEEEEMTEGAFAQYSLCTGNGLSADCINLLRPVQIRCLPESRDGDTITLKFPTSNLWEKVGGAYKLAENTYPVKDIGKREFRLHGCKVSSSLRDYSITATHSANGCTDTAKYTVYQCKFTIYSKPPALDSPFSVSLKFGKVDFDVGHTSWKLELFPDGTKIILEKLTPRTKHLNVCVGYWPTENLMENPTPPGELRPDSPAGASKSYDITIAQLLAGLSRTYDIEQSPGTYKLGTRLYVSNKTTGTVFRDQTFASDWNCTSACLDVGKTMGLSMPSALTGWTEDDLEIGNRSFYVVYGGNSPWQLYKNIQ